MVTNKFRNKNCIQQMIRFNIDKGNSNFIFYWMGEGVGEEGFFWFSLFPMCSNQVPKLFPNMFPRAPYFYPICFAQSYPLFSPMKVGQRRSILSSNKNFFFGEPQKFQFCFVLMGQSTCWLSTTYSPFHAPPISLGWKWWQTNVGIEFMLSQWRNTTACMQHV
jgi:hypothetical protein